MINFEVIGNGPPGTGREGPIQREAGKGAAAELLAFFRTTRPLSSLVAGAMSASMLIAGQGHLSARSIAAGLAMTGLAMFGFVINDAFDCEKDVAGGVRRPIASGQLSITRAVILAFGLLVPAFGLSMIAGSGGKVLAITSLGLIAYSPIAQRYPLGKGVCVAVLCCSPLFYGSVVGAVSCPLFSYVTLGCFVFGRETLMDAEELVGDRRAGLETIAAVLGYRRASRIGVAVMFLSTGGLVAVARSSAGRIAASAMLLCLACVFVWRGLSDSTRIKLSRIPMLVGAVAIAIGSK